MPGSSWGTKHRNHCPACLFSRHVDERGGEWAIIHRCTGCGALKANRIAGDDSERALLALALRPLARPAFPLDDAR